MKKKIRNAAPADHPLQHVPDGGHVALSEEDLAKVSGGNASVSSGGVFFSGTGGSNIQDPSETQVPVTVPVAPVVPTPGIETGLISADIPYGSGGSGETGILP